MNTFAEYVDWLINFLEKEENKKIKNYTKKERQKYICSLSPKQFKGNPADDESARPTVVISFNPVYKDAEVREIYLNTQRKGIGTKIVEKLIELCRTNNIQKLYFCDLTTNEDKNFIKKIGYDEEAGLRTYIKYIR